MEQAPSKQVITKVFKVFIGGIPFNSTRQELNNYFAQFGKVNLIELPKTRKSKKLKGYAFVGFANRSAMLKVLEHKELKIRGKTVTIRPHMDKDAARLHTKSLQRRKIFVQGFKLNTTEIEIFNFFSQFGEVDRVLMGNSCRKTGFKGFAYVVMKTEFGYKRVFSGSQDNLLEFNGYLVQVAPSKSSAELKNFKIKKKTLETFYSKYENCYAGDLEGMKADQSMSLLEELRLPAGSEGSSFGNKPQEISSNVNNSNRCKRVMLKKQSTDIMSFDSLPPNMLINQANQGEEIPEESDSPYSNGSAQYQPFFKYQSKLQTGETFDLPLHRQRQYPPYLDLTGADLIREHHLVFKTQPSPAQCSPIRRTESSSHQEMTFTANLTGSHFVNAPSLPSRDSHFGPQNGFGDNHSDPQYVRDRYRDQIFEQENSDTRARVYLGPRFIQSAGPLAGEEGQLDPAIEIKQTITTRYVIKNSGVLYRGIVNETNVWGSHAQPSQD
jgi:RNA recognition motif-containing protein